MDTQPAWFFKDGDALLDALGQKRMENFIGLQTWRKAGAKVALNADHMQGFDPDTSLNPYNPFLGMWITLSRRPRGMDAPLHPEHTITRQEAIRFYTINNAFLSFEEKEKGSLETGKLADFIVLNEDILSCPVDDIRNIQVLQTYLGGKLVYTK